MATSGDDFVRILLQDFLPSPPDAVAVGTGNLTDIPITTAPNVGLFSSVGNSTYIAFDNAGGFEGRVDFTVTSITAAPEPSTILLLGLGVAGIALTRRRA